MTALDLQVKLMEARSAERRALAEVRSAERRATAERGQGK